jgi:hypothetical protein
VAAAAPCTTPAMSPCSSCLSPLAFTAESSYWNKLTPLLRPAEEEGRQGGEAPLCCTGDDAMVGGEHLHRQCNSPCRASHRGASAAIVVVGAGEGRAAVAAVADAGAGVGAPISASELDAGLWMRLGPSAVGGWVEAGSVAWLLAQLPKISRTHRAAHPDKLHAASRCKHDGGGEEEMLPGVGARGALTLCARGGLSRRETVGGWAEVGDKIRFFYCLCVVRSLPALIF